MTLSAVTCTLNLLAPRLPAMTVGPSVQKPELESRQLRMWKACSPSPLPTVHMSWQPGSLNVVTAQAPRAIEITLIGGDRTEDRGRRVEDA
jgi:hypothetical protein